MCNTSHSSVRRAQYFKTSLYKIKTWEGVKYQADCLKWQHVLKCNIEADIGFDIVVFAKVSSSAILDMFFFHVSILSLKYLLVAKYI